MVWTAVICVGFMDFDDGGGGDKARILGGCINGRRLMERGGGKVARVFCLSG